MEIKPLTPGFAVGPQIRPEDVPVLKAKGYRSIIVNRPDNEDPGQPLFAHVAEAAEAEGLAIQHIPVVPNQIDAADVEKFRAALKALPGPVFAYCRSGGRAAQMWQLAQDG